MIGESVERELKELQDGSWELLFDVVPVEVIESFFDPAENRAKTLEVSLAELIGTEVPYPTFNERVSQELTFLEDWSEESVED